MGSRTPELQLDNQLCFALYDTSRAMTRAYGPLLSELGLTYPQYLVMLVLWEADGPVSVGQLGASLHLDSGTLTPLLKRLSHQGLLERSRDPADERRVLITLSPEGRLRRERATTIPAQIFGLCGIDASTAQELRDILSRVVVALGQTGEPAGPRS